MAVGSQASDPTLHLPRVLCLHGGGTNARIFRMQCRAFKYHLGRDFRFVFAQAPFPSAPGPDVTSVYSSYGPFRSWLRPVQAGDDAAELRLCAAEAALLIQASINAAIAADNHLGATGDVVGVLGFSQGARVAASLLYNQQLRRRQQQQQDKTAVPDSSAADWPEFRFGVPLAGRGRLVWLSPDAPVPPPHHGLVAPLQPAGMPPLMLDDAASWGDLHVEAKLELPTIHVHGVKDVGLELHRQLAKRYCLPASSTVVEWQGEHRVPIKTKDVSLVGEHMLRLAR